MSSACRRSPLSRCAGVPYYYFDAELFQHAPETLLPKLSDWLELDTPLSERYQIFSHTGKPRKGDSSARIHSGTIDRTPVDYAHIAVPEDVLHAARAAYRECRREIIGKAADSLGLDISPRKWAQCVFAYGRSRYRAHC
jgi:hypothetical protein